MVLGAAILAILVDRAALYSWGSAVQLFYVRLDSGMRASGAAAMKDVRPPWLFVGPPGQRGASLDVAFVGGSIRADRVTLEEDRTLKLLFLPPCWAWSTRLFPLGFTGSSAGSPAAGPVFYYAFELSYRTEPPAGVSLLLRRKPVPSDSLWPRFY